MRIKSLLAIAAMLAAVCAGAQESEGTLKESNFSASLELSSKYMWRGQEYGDAPVVFPMISYDYKGFNAYAMGGYAINGSHSEVDMGVSYTYKWLNVAVNDYYYPTAVGEKDSYFEFAGRKTGHYLEGAITVAPENIPFYLLASTYFFGADKKPEGRQGYSSYVELGYSHAFSDDNTLSLIAGAALNKSFYNNFETGFSVCNVAVKYETAIPFGKYKLPVSASYIINPQKEKSYVTFSVYLRK